MNESMSISQKDSYYKTKMTTEDFNRLSKFIYNELGIKMPIEKKLMLQSRLLKRLSELQLDNFKVYLDFVFSKEGKSTELKIVTDLVTTNKTDFFRELTHLHSSMKSYFRNWLKRKNRKGSNSGVQDAQAEKNPIPWR